MTSRLASLLVQDGLVSAKKMAEAFQRQVIYGGTLDTILLEMDVLDEGVLIEAMARASALPTAGDLPAAEQLKGAAEWLPRALSERFRAAPVALDSNVLRVLVTDPPDRVQLDELGYLVGRSIDPVVVPEHRFVQLVEQVYGVPVPARLASLSAKLLKRNHGAPARPPSLTPTDLRKPAEQPLLTPNEAAVLQAQSSPQITPQSSSQSSPQSSPQSSTEKAAQPAAQETAINASESRAAALAHATEPRRTVVSDVPMPQAPKPIAEGEPPAGTVRSGVDQREANTPRATPRQSGAPTAPLGGDVAVRVDPGTPGPATPIPLDEAARLIDGAGDRDAIFEALCRGARSQLAFAALLTVHGDTAVGRLALGAAWLDREALARVSVTLDRPSPFRAAVHGRAPYLGRLGEENLGATVLHALGRRPPLPAVLLPIVLRDRAVALLYADAGGQPIDAALLAGLSTATAGAARSFQRLILRAKGGEYAKAPSTPSGKLSTAPQSPSTPPQLTPASEPSGNWRRPEPGAGGGLDTVVPAKARPTIPGFPMLSQTIAGEVGRKNGDHGERGAGDKNGAPWSDSLHEADTDKIVHRDGAARTGAGDLDALVESVASGDERSNVSADALVALGERGARVAIARMPGPLRLARHTLRGPTPPLSEHGPLLALISRFGALAAPLLVARANDPSLEVRYYATLALGELRLPESIPTLGQRALDGDAGVRRVALEMLVRAPASPQLRTLTESLRGELPGPDSNRQQYAAEALGALHDVPSVPRIIELVKHANAHVVAAARQALLEITKQDFGTSRWRWRSWWERHRNQPRVEWMLEGLGHAEAEVRLSASEELKTMTSEYFGYHFDLPKREREEARRKWIDWWRAHEKGNGR
ncbi:MAG TPA: HEAT repeat domain-containing protein [Polyangia bacterium]|nr:HEAT repeat domain-containing protein [Polyangia bacterium]